MAEWVIFQDGARLAHHESERGVISRAAAALDGQILLEAQTQHQPLSTQLTFEEADHGLWHLRSGENFTVLHADGRVVVEKSDGERRIQTDFGYVGK